MIAPAYDVVEVHAGPGELAEGLGRLTPGQPALLALHWCVAEVCNGGFDQFFENSTGILAAEALEGMRRIGAAETAGVLLGAMRVFPGAAPPLDRKARVRQLKAVSRSERKKRFEPLEDRFYKLVDTELYPRAAEYVRAHPDEFVRP